MVWCGVVCLFVLFLLFFLSIFFFRRPHPQLVFSFEFFVFSLGFFCEKPNFFQKTQKLKN